MATGHHLVMPTQWILRSLDGGWQHCIQLLQLALSMQCSAGQCLYLTAVNKSLRQGNSQWPDVPGTPTLFIPPHHRYATYSRFFAYINQFLVIIYRRSEQKIAFYIHTNKVKPFHLTHVAHITGYLLQWCNIVDMKKNMTIKNIILWKKWPFTFLMFIHTGPLCTVVLKMT